CITLTDKNIADQVTDGVALAPTEIDVRDLFGPISQIQQQRGDRIWHRRCFGSEDPISGHLEPADLKLACELRRITDIDLVKKNRISRGYMVVAAFLELLVPVLNNVPRLTAVGHDPYVTVGNVVDESLS